MNLFPASFRVKIMLLGQLHGHNFYKINDLYVFGFQVYMHAFRLFMFFNMFKYLKHDLQLFLYLCSYSRATAGCVIQNRLHFKHPSLFWTHLIRLRVTGAGANTSCQWARGRAHRGQITSPSQGHTEINYHIHSHSRPGPIYNNQLT